MTFNLEVEGVVIGWGISTSQRPSEGFLTPSRILCWFLKTVILCFLNCTTQLSSHSFPTERREALFKSGKTSAVLDALDNPGSGK